MLRAAGSPKPGRMHLPARLRQQETPVKLRDPLSNRLAGPSTGKPDPTPQIISKRLDEGAEDANPILGAAGFAQYCAHSSIDSDDDESPGIWCAGAGGDEEPDHRHHWFPVGRSATRIAATICNPEYDWAGIGRRSCARCKSGTRRRLPSCWLTDGTRSSCGVPSMLSVSGLMALAFDGKVGTHSVTGWRPI